MTCKHAILTLNLVQEFEAFNLAYLGVAIVFPLVCVCNLHVLSILHVRLRT